MWEKHQRPENNDEEKRRARKRKIKRQVTGMLNYDRMIWKREEKSMTFEKNKKMAAVNATVRGCAPT